MSRRAARRGLGARLGDAGDRGLAAALGEEVEPPCVYLHGVGDPGNVGAIVRTAGALLGGTVVLGPDCADPHGAEGGAGEHGRDLRPAAGRAGIDVDRRAAGGAGRPRRRRRSRRSTGCATICLGAEREGLPAGGARAVRAAGDDPAARRRRPSRSTSPPRLPIAAQRISSPRDVGEADAGCLTGSRR